MTYEPIHERFGVTGSDGQRREVEFVRSGFLAQGDRPELFFFRVSGEEAVVGISGGSLARFDDHKDEIAHYEQMLGAHRGRLAVTLDRVTNAMVLVGQHGVYCHSQRDATKPAMDIQIITQELGKAKELIQNVMEELRAERENRLRTN